MAERRFRYVLVDVFTRRAFGGNPLAVLTAAEGLADAEMQAIARELNLSETTFVLPSAVAGADAWMRIFTPGRELPFAGHPTVGTGFVLGSERGRRQLTLELGVGPLRVEVEPGDGRTGSARMEQPLPTFRPAGADAATLARLVGVEPGDVAGDLPPEFGSAGVEFLYLPLRSLDAVRRARADARAMGDFFGSHDHPTVYLFTTEVEDAASAAHARMFALTLGSEVREDPATGGASGPFGAYLVRHGVRPPGRLRLEQGYEMHRPSLIEVDVELAAGSISRVRVGGGVVRMAEGELSI